MEKDILRNYAAAYFPPKSVVEFPIINDDYTFAIPFAYKSFLGIRKTFQHPYSRHIDFFGDENCVIEASEIIKKFNFYSFNLVNVIFENIKYVSKKYQQIKLQNEVLYS